MRHDPIDPELFTLHRLRLVERLPPGSLAVVHAADVLPTTGDGTLRLHPASDLFWLSGIEQEESVLVLAPGATDPALREILFIRQSDEHLAQWEGHKLTKDEATARSGIRTIRWLTDLPKVLHGLLCESQAVVLNTNEHERAVVEVEPRDLRMARRLMAAYPLHRYERLAPLLRSLRAVKDPAEIALTREAIDITAAGLRRMLGVLEPGVKEYELEAELVCEFTRRRARMAYEPIIATGANACVLHYVDNLAECRAGELLLVDVGASYANYSADLTRTYPVSGVFTPRQRAVYDAVLRVLRSSIARATVGITAADVAADTPESPACRKYFMHGLGHSLGLGVHDLAPIDGPLAPGWIMTVEPGIYIPEEGLAVRLENDILVTESGPVDLASHVPIEPDEIEAVLAR